MSIPKKVHIPPRINREDFQAGYMKPLSYSLEDISSAIVDHLRRKNFTERQLEGLAKFKSKGGWASVNPEDPDNLKKKKVRHSQLCTLQWGTERLLRISIFPSQPARELLGWCGSILYHACSWGRVGL
jgi:hypothetical protein